MSIKTHLWSLLLTLAALPLAAQNRTETLNDGWTFEGQPVRLPHTWNTDAYTAKDYFRGAFAYERTLHLEANAAVRRYLKVDAACKTAKVFVNGQLALTHQGGYTAFVAELTPYLTDGDNQLRIEVDNQAADVPPVSADFTFMGGIYRDVWLIEKPLRHFSLQGGLDVVADTLGVSTTCRITGLEGRTLTVETRLLDAEGRLLSRQRQRLRKQQAEVAGRLTLSRPPQLWSPEHPYLYRVEATLYDSDGRTVLDQAVRQVGVRYFRFDPEQGFFLNGQPYKLRGVNRHQDQQPWGVAIDDDMHRRDFSLIKQMGANFIRLAHYPQDDAFLDECDRQGMLVWEETPIVNYVPEGERFADNCEAQLREMIRNHRHHTSIILWGYMNEILLEVGRYYQGDARQTAVARTLSLARRLEDVLHQEDPTRTSTMACHGSDEYNTAGLAAVPQVVGWNLYQGWYSNSLTDFDSYLADQHRRHPGHPLFVSEYGAGSDLRLHSLAPRAFDFSTEYQQQYAEHYVPFIEQTPYVSGAAYWNFIDFSSASRDESMPRINNKGLVTAHRTPKDVYYYFQSCWRTDPMVHLATRDWPQRTAFQRQMPVKVYTNQPTVELFVGHQSLGRRRVENCTAVFDVTFADGDNRLRAVTDGGEDVHTVVFDTPQGEWAVNVGSQCYFQSAKSSLTWQPDQPYTQGSYGYIGGEAVQTQAQVHLTDDGPLYQTQRKDLQAYRFDVPRGDYEVELLTADLGASPVQARRVRYQLTTQADSLVVHFPQGASLAAIKVRAL